MANKNRYTVDEMIRAAEATFGLVSQMAKMLRCTDDTVRRYIRLYPTVKRAVDNQREALVDNAEIALRNAVLNGEQWAVKLVLQTLGKNRGYTTRNEVTGADGEPIELTGTVMSTAVNVESLSNDQLSSLLQRSAEFLAVISRSGAGESSGYASSEDTDGENDE